MSNLRDSLQKMRSLLRPYHPVNWGDTRRKWKERDHAHSHVFSLDPPVVYLWWGRDHSVLHRELKDEKLIVLYMFPWYTLREDVPVISGTIRNTLRQFPNHRIVLLCNELFTVELFRKQGLETIHCNQNCFINEDVFHPDDAIPKLYDALYNATMSPYKRHPLARQISSLALTTYRYGGTHKLTYEAETQAALAHAHWLVDSTGDREKVPVEQLVHIYQQCRVGLCLSAHEGAMFVSMEYLLCGLPVVTTRNIGGRDDFFDSSYVVTVDDTPEAVAAGVDELCRRALPSALVREKALAKVREHRERLRAYLAPELSPLQIPWPPGSAGPFNFTSLHEIVRACRAAPRC